MALPTSRLRRPISGLGVALLTLGAGSACATATATGSDLRPGASTAPPITAASAHTGGWPGPQLSSISAARKELAALTIADRWETMDGYAREKFPHWMSQGNSCDTRESVLERDGQDVKIDSLCRSVTGTWYSVYDGLTLRDPAKTNTAHLVPLANAWRSGADKWTSAQRKVFANDLTHPQLLTVSAESNRAKGDQGPEDWKPPLKTAWCGYARAWVDVKTAYNLSVTKAEKTALGQMLDTCPGADD
ncbi:DUF1524 domain-containing protein [Streptomyces sp. CB03911]|uniref:GmrSD restriction endonuclease domain-containing protein n=1 Tax=Streptomycetaceae TaxID=2062 RepID=UPI002570E8B1|nr:DUF1524 domain-containing protein [Streptomyces sp. CB03911]